MRFMARLIVIVMITVTVLAGIAPAQATWTVDGSGDCVGWSLTNNNDEADGGGVLIVASSDPAVSGRVESGETVIYASVFDGSNGTLEISLLFDDGWEQDQTIVRDEECEPTTTTAPPVTTTTTTVPEPTTTTTVPPVTTTTTIPKATPRIVGEILCENRDAATGAHEPLVTFWDWITDGLNAGEYSLAGDYSFAFTVEYPEGTIIGYGETASLTSPGRHDSWVSDPTVPVPRDIFFVNLYLNDELIQRIEADCSVPETTTTAGPTTTTTAAPVCVEIGEGVDAEWVIDSGPNEGDPCLPFTGPDDDGLADEAATLAAAAAAESFRAERLAWITLGSLASILVGAGLLTGWRLWLNHKRRAAFNG